jgi:phospholipid:diacylglycerol acyltransferase
VVPRRKLERLKSDVKQKKGKGNKRRAAWIFTLGGVFGIFVAGFFASSTGSLDRFVEFAGIKDMNLDSILDILPAGIIKDVQDLQVSCPGVLSASSKLMLTRCL